MFDHEKTSKHVKQTFPNGKDWIEVEDKFKVPKEPNLIYGFIRLFDFLIDGFTQSYHNIANLKFKDSIPRFLRAFISALF